MRWADGGPWTAGSRSIPSGELIGGRKFADIKELKQLLRSTAAKKFTRCLVENMLTYGLGRGLEAYDYCTVEDIRKQLAANDYRIQNIIFGIVESQSVPVSGRRREDDVDRVYRGKMT